ncbi:helix-turn-helix domain-containing protein [Haloferula sargassicola]|uniref:Chromosomal replication initiator protein DnaA n=1 Tax=Haloferula sargassicola TaxID=490096 RepID=A0ABP9UN31_9BACT
MKNISHLFTPQTDLSAQAILTSVAVATGHTVQQFIGPQRPQPLAWHRQIAMQLCRELLHLPYSAIGHHFGGRDHGTVMHACRAVSRRIAANPEDRALYLRLRARAENGDPITGLVPMPIAN